MQWACRWLINLAVIIFLQANSYFPSHRASPLIGQHQIILVDDRDTGVNYLHKTVLQCQAQSLWLQVWWSVVWVEWVVLVAVMMLSVLSGLRCNKFKPFTQEDDLWVFDEAARHQNTLYWVSLYWSEHHRSQHIGQYFVFVCPCFLCELNLL